jgi:hypothetical protein
LPHAGPHGIFDCDCACAQAPDYSSLANASTQAAAISDALGREQIAEAKRQYDLTRETTLPIIEAQRKAMEQSYQQGAENYNTFKTEGRPIQQMLRDEALGVTSAIKQRQMNEASSQAIADARQGTTQQMNQLIRQGARYGWSPAKLAAMGTSAAVAGAQSQVASSNAARTQAGDKYYGKLGDVYNTYTGLGSSAPTFYQAGTSAGSAAAGTQQQTAAGYLNGIAQGTNTITSGLGMQLSGLGNVLNSQTSFANGLNSVYSSQAANYQSPFSQIMGGAGAVAGLATAFSDRRLKENIVLVGTDESGRFNLYEFTYIGSPDKKFIGVMADEVEPLVPDAVIYDDLGFASVDYAMIGVPFKEIKNATA